MREVCWDTSGEQNYFWVPAAGGVDAGKSHAAPGHPAALSSQGSHHLSPYSVTCHPLSPTFIHPVPSISLWSRPWASAEGTLWSKTFWTAANFEVCSQLLESSFKNRNSCGKNCGQSCQTTVKPTSEDSFLRNGLSPVGEKTLVPKGTGESFGRWWPLFLWPYLTCQQEINFIAKWNVSGHIHIF